MSTRRTEISAIGEVGLIERIRGLVDIHVDDATVHDNLILGISDDTAVFRPTPGKVQLFTTDAFVEGVHFDLTFTSLKHLGWKAMVANLSDIAAMGGTPRYATMSLSLPAKISVEMIEELYEGALFACKKYSCLLVGGDTTASLANMMLSVAMTGEASEERVVYRKGAKPGDLLCVTGHLGSSHAGLRILERERRRFAESAQTEEFRLNLEAYKTAIEKHLMPKPRLDVARLIADRVSVHAMIDISDGLASEVHRMCLNSGVGAKVYEHNIPVESVTQTIAREFSEHPTDYALYGGEEYELLFAATDEEFEKLECLTDDVTILGRVTEKSESIELVRENGEAEALKFGGWDHFRQ
ncbi:MAG: thiamine-phosphate kinase [Bacteroidota bacterium]|jgi:thiamine-monophosphate kinase